MESYKPYIDWIKEQEQEMLSLTSNWVSIPSHAYDLDGLQVQLKALKKAFSPLEAQCSSIPLYSHKTLTSEGNWQENPLGDALLLTKRKETPIKILLAGHYDTVYLKNSSLVPFKEKEKGVWLGSGAADMKGGIVVMLTALQAYEKSPIAKKIGWEVLLTPDEEIGSPGSTPLYEEAAKRCHAALIFEPTFPDGALVSERMGSINLTIAVKGRDAHVGRDFSSGISAVYPIASLIDKIGKLNKENQLIINAADLQAKGPLNIVPPIATTRINIRSFDKQLLSDALIAIYKYAKEEESKGVVIEISKDSLRSPKRMDQSLQEMFSLYQSCANDLSYPFSSRQTGGVCDGNTLASMHLPTIDTAGVVGGKLHTSEEYLIQGSLTSQATLAALFLIKCAENIQLLSSWRK